MLDIDVSFTAKRALEISKKSKDKNFELTRSAVYFEIENMAKEQYYSTTIENSDWARYYYHDEFFEKIAEELVEKGYEVFIHYPDNSIFRHNNKRMVILWGENSVPALRYVRPTKIDDQKEIKKSFWQKLFKMRKKNV